jgi:choline-sulfatase
MTGWYPHVRGHRTLWHLLRPDEPNLLRYLTQAGYDDRMYGKNDLLAQASFADSVEEARNVPGRGHGRGNPWPEDDPRVHSFLFGPTGDPRDHHDYACTEAGLRFLREDHARPFCLYLPLSSPHPPYAAPDPFHTLYDPALLPPLRPAGLPNKPRFYEEIRRSRRLDQLGEATLCQIRATYLGMISYTDWLLGELLRTLDETGLAQNTVVMVFSDHGDWAGDYGIVEKWPSGLDDALTRVPFVVRLPGGAVGHTVNTVTELLDLTPTVLDMAGIPLAHTQFGCSLVPQLRGAAGDAGRAAFAEGGYDGNEPHDFEGKPGRDEFARAPTHIYWPKGDLQQRDPLSVCRATMIRTATHKLIRRPQEVSELYDLAADPQELHNRYDDPPYAAVQIALERRLLDWYVHTSDVTPFQEDPRGQTAPLMGRAQTLQAALVA